MEQQKQMIIVKSLTIIVDANISEDGMRAAVIDYAMRNRADVIAHHDGKEWEVEYRRLVGAVEQVHAKASAP